jgi:hypothetical protein
MPVCLAFFRGVVVLRVVAKRESVVRRDKSDSATHIFARTYPTMRPLWSSATNEICGQVMAWYIPEKSRVSR